MEKNKEVTVIGCAVQDIDDEHLGRLDLFYDSSIPKDLLVGTLFNLVLTELCDYSFISFCKLLNDWLGSWAGDSYEFQLDFKQKV